MGVGYLPEMGRKNREEERERREWKWSHVGQKYEGQKTAANDFRP